MESIVIKAILILLLSCDAGAALALGAVLAAATLSDGGALVVLSVAGATLAGASLAGAVAEVAPEPPAQPASAAEIRQVAQRIANNFVFIVLPP